MEHDRKVALAILSQILWKDMAYENECMPEAKAEEMAQHLISEHESPDSKFFSNGNWAMRESWNPMTDSTFDSGIIITNPDGIYSCIWIQDED